MHASEKGELTPSSEQSQLMFTNSGTPTNSVRNLETNPGEVAILDIFGEAFPFAMNNVLFFLALSNSVFQAKVLYEIERKIKPSRKSKENTSLWQNAGCLFKIPQWVESVRKCFCGYRPRIITKMLSRDV